MRCRSGRCLAASALAATLLSCSAGDGSPAATIDTLPGGTVRVVNHRPSLWTDADSAWRFVLERKIAPAEGSPGELGSIQAVALLGDGRVATMEMSPARLRLYDTSGQWVRDIGGEGDGPGEFRDGSMTAIGGTLVVHDPSNSRLVLFDTTGGALAMHRCNCAWYHDLLVLGQGRLGVPGSDETGRGVWHVTDPATGSVSGTIPFPSGPPVAETARWRASRDAGGRILQLTRNIPNHPVFRWAVLPDGSLAYGINDRYLISFGAGENDTVLTVSAPSTELRLTPEEREALYEAEIATVPSAWRDAIRAAGSVSDIPARVPPWASISALPDGSVMVRLPGADGSPLQADLIAADGLLLGRIVLPEGLPGIGSWSIDERDGAIRRVARSEGEDGLPVINVYRLERGSSAGR